MRLRSRIKNAVLLILAAVFVPFLWMGLFAGPGTSMKYLYFRLIIPLETEGYGVGRVCPSVPPPSHRVDCALELSRKELELEF